MVVSDDVSARWSLTRVRGMCRLQASPWRMHVRTHFDAVMAAFAAGLHVPDVVGRAVVEPTVPRAALAREGTDHGQQGEQGGRCGHGRGKSGLRG